MPKKSTIEPFRAWNGSWCVTTPVDLRGDRSKEERRFFKVKADAFAYARELQARRDEVLAPLLRMDRQKLSLVVEALNVAGDPESLLDAAKFWKAQRPGDIATLKELAIRCVASKEMSRKSDAYCNELKLHLQAFCEFMDGKNQQGEAILAHMVQPHHVEQWVNAKIQESQFTKQTRLRNLRSMFSFAVKNRIVAKNPAEDIEAPVTPDAAPIILEPHECERLMRTAEAEAPGLVHFLALCLFGGLRPEAEALKVHKDSIRENHIEVFGKRVRARNRRLVTLNPTLRAWLDAFPIPDSPLVNHIRRMRALRAASVVGALGPCREIRWHQDILRHSFVSYHCKIHGEAATAGEAGHSEAILFKHYKELVTRADAERFWSILPTVKPKEP